MKEQDRHQSQSINNKSLSHKMEKKMLEKVVEELCKKNNNVIQVIQEEKEYHSFPSRDAIKDIIEGLRSVLFPGYYGTSELTLDTLRFYVGSTLDSIIRLLKDQIKRGLCFICTDHPVIDRCQECEEQALSITNSFLERLPYIRQLLMTDIKATFEGDPATTSTYETIFCYPGILAITSYRLAHELYLLGVPLIPRIITEQAHSLTGIDIHPGAAIGESFFMDHGTGIVIGETCIIGKNVRIYQGVTLGAKSFNLDDEGKPIKGIDRHPIVEENVIIYSGATILGRVVIGRDSIVGGNVWLTHSIPPGSRITQVEAREEMFQKGGGI